MTISLIAMLSIIVVVAFGTLWALAAALRSKEASEIRRLEIEERKTTTSIGNAASSSITWNTPSTV